MQQLQARFLPSKKKNLENIEIACNFQIPASNKLQALLF